MSFYWLTYRRAGNKISVALPDIKNCIEALEVSIGFIKGAEEAGRPISFVSLTFGETP